MGLKEERRARRDRDAARDEAAALLVKLRDAQIQGNKVPGLQKNVTDLEGRIRTTRDDTNNYLVIKNAFFNAQNQTVLNTFGALVNKTNAEIIELTNNVSNQNEQLREQIEKNKSNFNESEYVKSEYQKLEIEKLVYQNNILWYVFYVIVLILGVVMFYFNTLSILAETTIFLVFLVYPFVIYYFELICYIIYKYLKSFFESTPFSNVYLSNY